MRLVTWIIIGLCLLIGNNYSTAGTLSSYTSVATLANGDKIPVVIISGDTNANINWYSLKEYMSSNLNWTDIKNFATVGGNHSGINWQSFGA